jgi:hypothetical protein
MSIVTSRGAILKLASEEQTGDTVPAKTPVSAGMRRGMWEMEIHHLWKTLLLMLTPLLPKAGWSSPQ